MADNPYKVLTCPMPGCGDDLYATFEHHVSLYHGSLVDREPLRPSDSDVSSWKVECVRGHVILVPTASGCPLDHDGADCACDVDYSEETRTFRASDIDRLRALLQEFPVNVDLAPEGGAR